MIISFQFWSAFIGCSSQFKDAVQLTLEQIDVIKRLVEANPDQMEFVTTAAGIEEAFANGKVASLIGMAILVVKFPREVYKIK